MDKNASLTRLAVFGSPVKHSLSPRIHQLFARQAGIVLDYKAIEVSADYLSREVQKLADSGGRGCNITLPLKQQAFTLANRASERATVAQAANILIFKTPNRWFADNTDGPGLVRDLLKNLAIECHQQRICVIGAGGAVAGILHDLLAQKPASLSVFNRTVEHARLLAERFTESSDAAIRLCAADLDDMRSAAPFDLVINATSTGHFRAGPVLTENLFGPHSSCYDLSYGKAHRALNEWCAVRGFSCHDGLGMLVEQAAESFFLWTGVRPDTAPVINTLRKL